MNDNQRRGGISFCGMLTIAFIVLKLAGYITWSWWWVLAPTWIPLALVWFACWFWVLPHTSKRNRNEKVSI